MKSSWPKKLDVSAGLSALVSGVRFQSTVAVKQEKREKERESGQR